MAAIGQLKTMPSNPTKYLREDRSVHLFLLTSQLDDGAIDLLPECSCDRCGFISVVLELDSGLGMRWGVPLHCALPAQGLIAETVPASEWLSRWKRLDQQKEPESW